MSFRTSISQQIINNVFYENSNVDLNVDVLDSIASVNYVNDEILNITTDISNINTAITDLQNQINTLNNSIVRITGSIFISVSSITPSYSLLCDGSSYLVSDYQNLFNIIGYAYGGFGLNFNVPNMQSTFLLGGNGTINNVPASNLLTGNGTTGSKNTFSITGNSWNAHTGQAQFCLLQRVPQHNHDYTDNGHSHSIGDFPNYAGFAPSTTSYINDTLSQMSAQSGISPTGIIISSVGQGIQYRDTISNGLGVNITPPYFSVNFYINI
jgi:microcystin-dependent protein